MEKDMEELQEKVLQFCEKYECAITIDTVTRGRTEQGIVIPYYITYKIIK